jgi:hypothetical protein
MEALQAPLMNVRVWPDADGLNLVNEPLKCSLPTESAIANPYLILGPWTEN